MPSPTPASSVISRRESEGRRWCYSRRRQRRPCSPSLQEACHSASAKPSRVTPTPPLLANSPSSIVVAAAAAGCGCCCGCGCCYCYGGHRCQSESPLTTRHPASHSMVVSTAGSPNPTSQPSNQPTAIFPTDQPIIERSAKTAEAETSSGVK